MMNDRKIIYLDDAIDAVSRGCQELRVVFARCEKILNELLSAQPEQRWIQCSETIDIPDHEVLACDKYGEYIIGLLAYEDEQWLCESEETMMYDPVAWMPLPVLYRKDGEE